MSATKCRWIVGGATGIGFAAAACPVHPGNVGAKRFAFSRRARKETPANLSR